MFEFFVFTVVLFGFWAFASHLSRGPADWSAKHWSSFGNVALRPKTWPPKGQIRRKLGSVDAAVLRNTGWVQKIQEKISGNHNWHCYLERLMAYIIMVYPHSLSLSLHWSQGLLGGRFSRTVHDGYWITSKQPPALTTGKPDAHQSVKTMELVPFKASSTLCIAWKGPTHPDFITQRELGELCC